MAIRVSMRVFVLRPHWRGDTQNKGCQKDDPHTRSEEESMQLSARMRNRAGIMRRYK
jgi:hypothetical protein